MEGIYSAKQRRGQKVGYIVQSDVPGSSVNKDMHHERTRKNES